MKAIIWILLVLIILASVGNCSIKREQIKDRQKEIDSLTIENLKLEIQINKRRLKIEKFKINHEATTNTKPIRGASAEAINAP